MTARSTNANGDAIIWNGEKWVPSLPPPPPLNRILNSNYIGPQCPKCSSDFPHRFWIFGKRRCINPSCGHVEK